MTIPEINLAWKIWDKIKAVFQKPKSLTPTNLFLDESKEVFKKLTYYIRLSPIEVYYNDKAIAGTSFISLGGGNDVLIKQKELRKKPVAISSMLFKINLGSYAISEFFPKEVDTNKFDFMFNPLSNKRRMKMQNEDVVLVRLGLNTSSGDLWYVYDEFETLGDFLAYLVRFKEHIQEVSGLRIGD